MHRLLSWLRGERVVHEVAPHPLPAAMSAAVGRRVVMRARICRAATGQWEDVGVLYDSDASARREE